MRESVSGRGKGSTIVVTKHQTLQVGMVYTVDSIMIAAGITLALVIFLTIFAFQVLLFLSSSYLKFSISFSDQSRLHRL